MFAIFGLVFLSLGAVLNARCGKRPSSSRVINGDIATPHSWPWQISLRVSGHYGSKHFCGGSLIRPNWVVTAAHCVYKDTDPRGYTVVVGAHRRTGKTDVQQTFNVNTLIVHEQFETQALRNDIALLKLDRPVQLNEKVATVCLPDKTPDRSANCYITGWGRTKEGRPADALQQAKMPITPHEECKKKYRKGYDRQVHLCAGEGREGSTGGCQGDSGGPFVCQTGKTWHLHGIVSFGERWCSTVYYTIFTRITTYVPWILSKIGGGGGGEDITLPPPSSKRTLHPSTRPLTLPAGCKDRWPHCTAMKHQCDGNWEKFRTYYCPRTCKNCS